MAAERNTGGGGGSGSPVHAEGDMQGKRNEDGETVQQCLAAGGAERNTGGGGWEAKVDTEADADARCKDGDGCRERIRIQSLLVEFL